jgi:NTP pyrophosphatase (non-canonical NTP hydrolase)
MTFPYYQNEVIIWARNRGIVQNSNPKAQAMKTLEEAGELIEATAKVQVLEELEAMMPELSQSTVYKAILGRWKAATRDAYADVLITEIVGAETADVDLLECLKEGFEEIKDRKGHLRPDGVFVKED